MGRGVAGLIWVAGDIGLAEVLWVVFFVILWYNKVSSYEAGLMNIWLETMFVLLLAVSAMLLGTALGRCGKSSYAVGLGLAFALMGAVLVGRDIAIQSHWPALYVLTASRIRFVLLLLSAGVGFGALIEHQTRGRLRWLSCGFAALIIAALWIAPFVSVAAVQDQLSRLETVIDADSVCRQTTPFTCGAAAAVSGLLYFGAVGDEAALALTSRTSPLIGASVWDLYLAVRHASNQAGIQCTFSFFKHLSDVPVGSVLLAVMRDTGWNDHCVAVLDIQPTYLTVADPACGLRQMTWQSFQRAWRGCGILLYKP